MTASFLSQCWSTENVGSAAYLWPSIEPWQYNGPILWLIHCCWHVSSTLTDGSVVRLLSNSLWNIYRTILQIDPALPLEFYAWISGPGRISTWSAEGGGQNLFFQKFSEACCLSPLHRTWDHAYSSSILYGKQNVILKIWSYYPCGKIKMPTKLIGKSEYLETGSITPRKNVDMNNGAFCFSSTYIYGEFPGQC